MKNLYQSLLDYNIVLLKGIAESRAVPLDTSKQSEAVQQLSKALLAPAAVAIALADLSEPEKEALQFLLEQGGQIERSRFTRPWGLIRPMGPARLERERPWRNPVNPAEGLWYRGFIFKAFQFTAQGSEEMIYIPTDLLPLLKLSSPNSEAQVPPAEPQTRKSFQISQASTPAQIASGQGRLRENIFNLLVYLQTTPVRLQSQDQLTTKDKETLANCLTPPLLPQITPAAELDFLLHLAQRTNLLVARHGRLRPDRDPTRTWLRATPDQQVQQLQNAWRADPTWNDLWHVPGLSLQPTGWENSPLLARSKILEYLAQIETEPDVWLAIDDFIAAIKQIEPDFQRPNGDYESWYIQDIQGRSLMGFKHWDQVEGALIRYILTHILLLLGIVEIGRPAAAGAPSSFRITPAGRLFFSRQSIDASPHQKPPFLRVDANFNTYVPARASLYDRFQLARFAQLGRRESERVIYQITPASVGRALRNGVTAEQITTFLARATNNQTPLKVVETLLAWGARQGAAHLEQATLLRLKREEMVVELQQHPALRSLLGEVIGPTTILIPPDNVREVRRLLTELGYLE